MTNRAGLVLRGDATRARRDGGFTLVEMVIVIALILILSSLLVGAIVIITTNAQYAKTEATVEMLDKACQVYKIEYTVFPPNDKGGSSKSLHYYLGGPRKVLLDSGGVTRTKPPILSDVKKDQLKWDGAGAPDPKNPVDFVDAWDQEIRYRRPGQWNKDRVDIWSAGKNGKDELDPAHKDFDDVVNWK